MESHRFSVRVYYEDTDAGGVVYYANYLKFAERARTEMLRDAGISQAALVADEGVVFVVKHVAVDLQKPARLDDLLEIETVLVERKRASFVLEQRICRDGMVLVLLTVQAVSVTVDDFKPVALPEVVKKMFN